MGKKRIKAAIIVIMIALPLIFGGCKNSNTQIKVMEYKETVLYLDEVSLWQAILEAEFEAASGVESAVWTQAGAKQQAKVEFEYRMKQVLILTQQAKEKNITLSDDELVKVQADAKAFYDQLEKEEIESLGLSLSTVEKVYEKQALFAKLQDYEVGGQVDEEAIMSTLEENSEFNYFVNTPANDVLTKARVKHLLIKTFNGNVPSETTNFSEEEKNGAKATAEQLLERVKDGEDLIELIQEFSEDEASLENQGEYTFTFKEMTEEFSKAAFSMEIGEIRLVETIYGYHIMRLEEFIKPTDDEIDQYEKVIEDYQKTLKNNLILARKQELFTPVYSKWEEEASADIVIDQNQWEKIEFGKGIGN